MGLQVRVSFLIIAGERIGFQNEALYIRFLTFSAVLLLDLFFVVCGLRGLCLDCSHRHFSRTFRIQRTRIASKLKNDRIRKIHFHTLRHWKATMEYAKTKDILHVMKMLGHRNIQNTLLYTQLISFENDEFFSATAKTVQDAQKLIEAGFEYVCEFSDVKIFKKRK